jgi:formylglycine-generating enzyme required for sulfatase activity
MRIINRSFLVLVSFTSLSTAQIITETFGNGANTFSIEFVQIGNPGNVADTSGVPNPTGSVPYIYNLGKYEISRDMIEKANIIENLGISLADLSSSGGNSPNRPASGITWYEAARFVNFLNRNSGFNPAYKFDVNGNFQLWTISEAGYNANNNYRNSLAKYFLPSTSEWYKGAYGSPTGAWFNYPTGSNTLPISVSDGTLQNTAVYGRDPSAGPADIYSAGGLSPYGTMGQGGNVWEWNESASDGINDTIGETRGARGGGWKYGSDGILMDATTRFDVWPWDTFDGDLGFRVASVPEPSALSLLAFGLGGLAMMRRRRQ